MKPTSLADECQECQVYQPRTKHPTEFPTNSISILQYIHIKGQSIHHSINEEDCQWWSDAISAQW